MDFNPRRGGGLGMGGVARPPAHLGLKPQAGEYPPFQGAPPPPPPPPPPKTPPPPPPPSPHVNYPPPVRHDLLLFAHLLLYVTGVLLYGFLARELFRHRRVLPGLPMRLTV